MVGGPRGGRTITIELSPEAIRARTPHPRRATVTLTRAVPRNEAGTTVSAAGPVTLRAIVGGMGRRALLLRASVAAAVKMLPASREASPDQ
jgi:hypothetical protein